MVSVKVRQDPSSDDLTAVVLSLARNLPPEAMAAQLSALWRTIEWYKDPGLDGLMVQAVDTMLELRDYPERLTKRGAKTIAQVVDRFQQRLDALVQSGKRQGIQQGQVHVLRRMADRKFGEATAGELSDLLDELPGLEDIDKVTDALVECATGDEFLDRVRMG